MKILEDRNANLEVVTETKKLKGSKYVGNYAMFCSGVSLKQRAAETVPLFIDEK